MEILNGKKKYFKNKFVHFYIYFLDKIIQYFLIVFIF